MHSWFLNIETYVSNVTCVFWASNFAISASSLKWEPYNECAFFFVAFDPPAPSATCQIMLNNGRPEPAHRSAVQCDQIGDCMQTTYLAEQISEWSSVITRQRFSWKKHELWSNCNRWTHGHCVRYYWSAQNSGKPCRHNQLKWTKVRYLSLMAFY